MNDDKVNFLDIIYLLVKGKKFIIIFTLIASLIAVVYSLVATERWASQTTVFPLTNQQAFSMMSSLMEGLGLGSSTTPRAMNYKHSAILKSRTITEETIKKYDLINYFNVTEKDSLKAIEKTAKKFHSKMFDILINDETQFMTIRLISEDKYFSRELTQHYLDTLVHYAQNNANNTGRQKRELLETRVNKITEEMLILSTEIKEYQTKHNIIEMEAQAKASIEGYGTILKEYLTIESELIYQEQFMPNSPRHRDLLDRRNVIRRTLSKLEQTNDEIPFFLALGNINENFFTIQEKIFGLEMYKVILETIHPQLELARIEEVDSMDKFEIIDYPNLPGKRAYPLRAMICIITFIVSFMFSSGCVLVISLLSEEDKQKLNVIWKNLF